MKKVHIVINPKTGQIEYEVEGVIGGACTDITSALTKGHLLEDEKLTEDYFDVTTLPAYVGD